MDSTVDCVKEMAIGALVTSSFVNTDEKKDKILHMPWVSETCVPSVYQWTNRGMRSGVVI